MIIHERYILKQSYEMLPNDVRIIDIRLIDDLHISVTAKKWRGKQTVTTSLEEFLNKYVKKEGSK